MKTLGSSETPRTSFLEAQDIASRIFASLPEPDNNKIPTNSNTRAYSLAHNVLKDTDEHNRSWSNSSIALGLVFASSVVLLLGAALSCSTTPLIGSIHPYDYSTNVLGLTCTHCHIHPYVIAALAGVCILSGVLLSRRYNALRDTLLGYISSVKQCCNLVFTVESELNTQLMRVTAFSSAMVKVRAACDSMASEYSRTNQQLRTAEQEVTSATDELASTRAELTETKAALVRAQEDLQAERRELTDTRAALTALQAQHWPTERVEMMRKLAAACAAQEAATLQLRTHESALDACRAQLHAKETELTTSTTQARLAAADHAEAVARLEAQVAALLDDKADGLIVQLQGEIVELKGEMAARDTALTQAKGMIDEMQTTITAQVAELTRLQDAVSQCEALRALLVTAEAKVSELEQAVAEKEVALATQQASLAQYVEQVQALEKDLDCATSRAEAAEQQAEAVNNALVAAADNEASLRAEKEELQHRCTVAGNSLATLQKQYDDLLDAVRKRGTEDSAMAVLQAQLNSAVADLAEARKAAAVATEAHTAVAQELATAKADLAAAAAAAVAAEAARERAATELAAARAEADRATQQCERLSDRVEALEAEARTAAGEANTLRAEVARQGDALAQRQSELVACKKEVHECRTQAQEARTALEQAHATSVELRADIRVVEADLVRAREDVQRLRGEVTAREDSLQAVELEATELRERLIALTGTHASDEQRRQHELATAKLAVDNAERNATQRVEQVRSEMAAKVARAEAAVSAAQSGLKESEARAQKAQDQYDTLLASHQQYASRVAALDAALVNERLVSKELRRENEHLMSNAKAMIELNESISRRGVDAEKQVLLLKREKAREDLRRLIVHSTGGHSHGHGNGGADLSAVQLLNYSANQSLLTGQLNHSLAGGAVATEHTPAPRTQAQAQAQTVSAPAGSRGGYGAGPGLAASIPPQTLDTTLPELDVNLGDVSMLPTDVSQHPLSAPARGYTTTVSASASSAATSRDAIASRTFSQHGGPALPQSTTEPASLLSQSMFTPMPRRTLAQELHTPSLATDKAPQSPIFTPSHYPAFTDHTARAQALQQRAREALGGDQGAQGMPAEGDVLQTPKYPSHMARRGSTGIPQPAPSSASLSSHGSGSLSGFMPQNAHRQHMPADAHQYQQPPTPLAHALATPVSFNYRAQAPGQHQHPMVTPHATAAPAEAPGSIGVRMDKAMHSPQLSSPSSLYPDAAPSQITGCRIATVSANSFASMAKLKPGDVVLSVNGTRTRSFAEFLDAKNALLANSTAFFVVRRGKFVHTIPVHIGRKGEPPKPVTNQRERVRVATDSEDDAAMQV